MAVASVGGRAARGGDSPGNTRLKTENFDRDPEWEGLRNRLMPTVLPTVTQDFGYSPTSYAGGRPGEVGGILWRGGKYAHYADRVGPLTLEDRLEARGRVVMVVGGVDADMYLGWFNSQNKDQALTRAGNFLGIHVGGPTRVGHYFQPAYATAKGDRARAEVGPLLTPGKAYSWSLVYDPAAAEGKGAIQVTLGQESVTLCLRKGCKQDVRLDEPIRLARQARVVLKIVSIRLTTRLA